MKKTLYESIIWLHTIIDWMVKRLNKSKIEIKKFDCFNVYSLNEGNSFIYAVCKEKELFIEGLVEYIFNEENLLNYAKRTNKINFSGDQRQYAKLYNNISMFLNAKLEQMINDDESDEVISILNEEYDLIDKNGKLVVQNDKVGKIGEYIFHLILTNYFHLDCILPKFKCTTDRNMSVFGIDTLFLDTKSRVIYFGESKFCKDIDHGISLINRSLKDYEEQIKEEYRIVLANDEAFRLSSEFEDIFGDAKQVCISFQELINVANIDQIGVPIFIAHGNTDGSDNTPEIYIDKMLNKINQKTLFGLRTKYLFISLPVISKNMFIDRAIKKAVEKQHEYERSR